jgi:hypothetical protein
MAAMWCSGLAGKNLRMLSHSLGGSNPVFGEGDADRAAGPPICVYIGTFETTLLHLEAGKISESERVGVVQPIIDSGLSTRGFLGAEIAVFTRSC